MLPGRTAVRAPGRTRTWEAGRSCHFLGAVQSPQCSDCLKQVHPGRRTRCAFSGQKDSACRAGCQAACASAHPILPALRSPRTHTNLELKLSQVFRGSVFLEAGEWSPAETKLSATTSSIRKLPNFPPCCTYARQNGFVSRGKGNPAKLVSQKSLSFH